MTQIFSLAMKDIQKREVMIQTFKFENSRDLNSSILAHNWWESRDLVREACLSKLFSDGLMSQVIQTKEKLLLYQKMTTDGLKAWTTLVTLLLFGERRKSREKKRKGRMTKEEWADRKKVRWATQVTLPLFIFSSLSLPLSFRRRLTLLNGLYLMKVKRSKTGWKRKWATTKKKRRERKKTKSRSKH